MRKRIVRSKVLLVLILSLFLTLEGLLPVVAFATDEPSEQKVSVRRKLRMRAWRKMTLVQ